MDNQQRITESVRALAAVFGDTNATLGVVLGISEHSAAGKRTGRLKWSVDNVEKIAQHYGVSVDQVLAGPRAWLGMADGEDSRPTIGYHSDADDVAPMAA